jgi:CheY-like chemotaxis protein/uncharacterized membrane protein YqhA
MSETILVIEDNPSIRENTAEILRLANYEIITASNGKEGLDIAVHQTPDLILCDIMMPEMNGYEVLTAVRSNPKMIGTPFIFLTAKTEKNEIREGMNLGPDDYITKPFNEADLLQAIKSRITKNKAEKKKSYSLEVRDFGLIQKTLSNTKWFIFPAILVLYMSTALLMLIGLIKLYIIIFESVTHFKDFYKMNFSEVSAQFITIIDIYLLAFVCYIFAVGIYKLFIGNFASYVWLKIETIDDLKLHMSKMAILFLATLVIQKIAKWVDPLEVLYFGIVITLICSVLIWYCMLLQKKEK